MTVLVVDDERKMAELLRRGFAEAGFAADLADTGEAAVEIACGSAYEAIVLDVLLPGIDGIEACRRIRDCGVDAPVVLLSARGAIEDRQAGMDAGADAYLLKPFSLGDLVARVRQLIQEKKVARPESHLRLRQRL
ncbi:MAG TPA: response regulator [Solirubrobacterales bacterium]